MCCWLLRGLAMMALGILKKQKSSKQMQNIQGEGVGKAVPSEGSAAHRS